MSDRQVVGVAATFIILAAITVAEQFKWLPGGRAQTVIVFLCGVMVSGGLWLAGLPPWWFSGGKDAFLFAGWLTFGGLVYLAAGERTFGMPLLLGMGLTLLTANLIAFVRNVL